MARLTENEYKKQLEKFILAYKDEPCLWKIQSRFYYDRKRKDAAYQRLVKIYRTIVPIANREFVVKKINCLRSSYKKEMRKMKNFENSDEGRKSYKSRLWYYDLLGFLYKDQFKTTSLSDIEGDDSPVEEIEVVPERDNPRSMEFIEIKPEASNSLTLKSHQPSKTNVLLRSILEPLPEDDIISTKSPPRMLKNNIEVSRSSLKHLYKDDVISNNSIQRPLTTYCNSTREALRYLPHRTHKINVSSTKSSTPILKNHMKLMTETHRSVPNSFHKDETYSNSSHRASKINGNMSNNEVIKTLHSEIERARCVEDRFEVYGKNVSMKLRDLPTQQRILAEKIINDTFFLAEMGRLTTSHCVNSFSTNIAGSRH